jgi:hypothetical protein
MPVFLCRGTSKPSAPATLLERAGLLLRARAAMAAGRFVLLYRDIHSVS